ncbi:S8 family serine peptidase [Streptomyces pacificus]|uniref:S8 family serine peptidase n=1 Tax=Streptomyces pacificus TaxID=2705029 RepID=UPI0020B17887|nr:S8 family serine peptidase [Streptomyces pacificus]
MLLSAGGPALAASPSYLPAATEGSTEQHLPGMPAAFGAEAGQTACTPASEEKAEKRDWSRQRLDLDQVHRHGTGAGVTVALIGTGVSPGAAGLGGRVTAAGPAGDDCVGYGTFLAGLIAGDGGDRRRLVGVAPDARILGLRGTDSRGRASAELVVEALREAASARAGVIAVAVALPRRDPALTRAVADARRAGAVVLAAAAPEPSAGDTAKTPSRVYWPAGEPGVLSVAGMVPSGARPEGSLPTEGVDLAAPGAGVVSGGARGEGHYLGGGAAVATAFAAGTAAVVRAARPDDPADAVARRLTTTAYPADIPQLDAYAAVTAVLGGSGTPTGTRQAADPVTVRDTSAADRTADRAARLVLLGSAAVLVVLWAAFAIPRARARRWRPAAADGR